MNSMVFFHRFWYVYQRVIALLVSFVLLRFYSILIHVSVHIPYVVGLIPIWASLLWLERQHHFPIRLARNQRCPRDTRN